MLDVYFLYSKNNIIRNLKVNLMTSLSYNLYNIIVQQNKLSVINFEYFHLLAVACIIMLVISTYMYLCLRIICLLYQFII